jgi:hypothetical protein
MNSTEADQSMPIIVAQYRPIIVAQYRPTLVAQSRPKNFILHTRGPLSFASPCLLHIAAQATSICSPFYVYICSHVHTLYYNPGSLTDAQSMPIIVAQSMPCSQVHAYCCRPFHVCVLFNCML